MIKVKASSENLILALDGMDKFEVFNLINQLPKLRWVKVGLELFLSAGPEVVTNLKDQGLKVFLDLKFHDIPKTMACACKQAAKTGAELITVHACAGIDALKEANDAAVQGASEIGGRPPTLLAVTVLTSWNAQRLASELAINQPLEKRVELLAQIAIDSGIGGCVCSPLEVRALRNLSSDSFELVTPGIRSKGFDLGDQSRVMTPTEAINAGASRIVIGRPITNASNVIDAFNSFCKELENIN